MTRRELFLSSFLGFLLVAFGQPTYVSWLAPVAGVIGYALFWRCLRIFPLRYQKFWRATLWYTCVSLVQLSWMAAYQYQGMYIVFVFVALALWMGLQFGVLSLLIPYGRAPSIPRALALASLWTLIEWGRYYFICGFTWSPAGLALSQKYAIQLASIGGILGLSFWVIFTNLLGLRALIKKNGNAYASFFVAALVPYLFGVLYFGYHQKKAETHPYFHCVLVQTGLLPPEKILLKGQLQSFINPYEQWGRIFQYIKDTKTETIDLVVLPEAALPFPCFSSVYQKKRVDEVFLQAFGKKGQDLVPNKEYLSNADIAQTLSNTLNTEVVAGLDYFDGKANYYNSAFHFVPKGSEISRYDKQILMPLAEYLPFAFLRPLVAAYGITEFFTHGDGPKIFQGAHPMAVSICYEDTFPEPMRKARQLGAKMLVNVTNDGWYPFTRLASEHFHLAKMRAVENGIPLIRACNTGVTAAVDSLGSEKGRLEEFSSRKTIKKGALFVPISTYCQDTLFSKWGNWFMVSLSSLFILGFGFFRKTFDW